MIARSSNSPQACLSPLIRILLVPSVSTESVELEEGRGSLYGSNDPHVTSCALFGVRTCTYYIPCEWEWIQGSKSACFVAFKIAILIYHLPCNISPLSICYTFPNFISEGKNYTCIFNNWTLHTYTCHSAVLEQVFYGWTDWHSQF